MNTEFFDFKIFAIEAPEKLLRQCVGDNEKKLLVLSNKSDEDIERWDLLHKILRAVQHDLKKDVAHLILHPNQQFCLSELDRHLKFDRVLSFGVAPKTAGLHFEAPLYKPFSFNQKTWLFAHTLQQIAEQPTLKKHLWHALKAIFSTQE